MTDPSQKSKTYGPKNAMRTFAISFLGGFAITFFPSCNEDDSESVNLVMALVFGIVAGMVFTIGDYLRNKKDNTL